MMRFNAGGTALSKDILDQLLSRRVLSVLALVAMIFLTSGGVYVVIESPGAMVSTSSGGSSFIANSSSTQTTVEFIVIMALTLGAAVGFMLLEGAMKKTFDLSGAKVKYTIAIILVLLCVLLLEFLIYAKV
jgi:uncharacterized membrane protein YidH (DUF202 family)